MYVGFSSHGNKVILTRVSQKSKESGVALSTLKRIEEIMRRKVNLDSPQTLLKEAQYIRDQYFIKTSQIFWLFRFLGRVGTGEKDISAVVDRIENLVNPPPLLNTPKELTSHILSYLSPHELSSITLVNKSGNNFSNEELMKVSQRFGYQGNIIGHAKLHLKGMHEAIRTLIRNKTIPNDCIVRVGGSIDYESTIKKMKSHSLTRDASGLQQQLSKAIETSDINLIKLLIFMGVEVNSPDIHHTPLTLAMTYGKESVITLLLESGANPNTLNNKGESPLGIAVRSYNTAPCVNLLLKFGADINQADRYGITALMQASSSSQKTELLLNYGADPNIANADGKTALMFAAGNSSKSTVQLLLKAGANPNATNLAGESVLLQFLKKYKSNEEIVEMLLAAGANPHITDQEGNTTLSLAVRNYAHNSVKVLLKAGVNPNKSNNHGITPLLIASNMTLNDIPSLLRFGADPNATDSNGNTALNIIMQQLRCKSYSNLPRYQIVANLIKSGANVNKINNEKKSALDYYHEYSSDPDIIAGICKKDAQRSREEYLRDQHGDSAHMYR